MNPNSLRSRSSLVCVLLLFVLYPGCRLINDTRGRVSFDTSADGKQLVFSAASGDLFLFDLDSKKVTRITESREIKRDPSFSPDGRTIVYDATAPDDSSATRIFSIDVGTKKVTQLTDEYGVSDVGPRFSRDGSKIYFSRAYRSQWRPLGTVWGDADLCVMNADGSDAKRLTTQKFYYVAYPVESPDGRSILFQGGKDLDSVFSFDLDGKGPARDFGEAKGIKLGDVNETASPADTEQAPGSADNSEEQAANTEVSPPAEAPAEPRSYIVVGEMLADLAARKAGWIDTEGLSSMSIRSPRSLPDNRLLFLVDIGAADEMGYYFELWSVGMDGKNLEKLAGKELFLDPLNWKAGK